MEIARKEKWLGFAGLGVALVGAAWFVISLKGILLQGMARMFGFPMGAGLALCGLIIAGVYYYRRARIRKLVSGKNLLVQWADGSVVYIAADCAYIDGTLHLWSGIGGRLEQVRLLENQSYGQAGTNLEIKYANSVQRRDLVTGGWNKGWESKQFSVGVPPAKLPEMKGVLEKLQERLAA